MLSTSFKAEARPEQTDCTSSVLSLIVQIELIIIVATWGWPTPILAYVMHEDSATVCFDFAEPLGLGWVLGTIGELGQLAIRQEACFCYTPLVATNAAGLRTACLELFIEDAF
eukprot:gnl/TRDRNA2_/TRDRNA2_176451_c1_seq10.p2 gnl/TRDRNA2_/TRDRNA2_176451_c1~~gnl/TRDRNA2_/TRDRNA2_176451_c1_seq10.p2  ORF type:complete len:113 (-),score=6.98 gnl/TRDRNA2_/TRDRNA2_176451_c1_seq10:341-679(-)